MILQKNGQCTIASIAMVLNEPVADLMMEVGHDGGLLPDASGIVRGYHIQELIDLCLKRGLAMTPIEIFPVSMDTNGRHWRGHNLDERGLKERFYNTIIGSRGVVEGQGLTCGHMVANDYGRIYDPKGYDYHFCQFDIYNFQPLCVWRIDAILPGRA